MCSNTFIGKLQVCNYVLRRGEGRPSWALLGCVSENNETALFREKFLDWTSRTGSREEAEVNSDTPVRHNAHNTIPRGKFKC